MSPVIPHITNECLNLLNKEKNEKILWPEIEKKYLNSDEKTIVIQINGRKRSTISIKDEITENLLIKKIKEMKNIEKYITNKEIQKTIYIKNKLINIIIK